MHFFFLWRTWRRGKGRTLRRTTWSGACSECPRRSSRREGGRIQLRTGRKDGHPLPTTTGAVCLVVFGTVLFGRGGSSLLFRKHVLYVFTGWSCWFLYCKMYVGPLQSGDFFSKIDPRVISLVCRFGLISSGSYVYSFDFPTVFLFFTFHALHALYAFPQAAVVCS